MLPFMKKRRVAQLFCGQLQTTQEVTGTLILNSRVTNLDYLKPDFKFGLFYAVIFFSKKSQTKYFFSIGNVWLRQNIVELHIHYKSFLMRV